MKKFNGSKTWMILMVLVLLISVSIVPFTTGCTQTAQEEIKVGLAYDITGPTSSAQGIIFEGFADYIKFINEKGGINNTKINLMWADTGYTLPKALSAYKRFKEQGMVLMAVQAAHEALALKPIVAQDQIPITSTGTDALVLVPPNWIFAGIEIPWADGFAGFLQWVKDTWKESRPPRVAIMGFDNALGRSPLLAEKYWKQYGIQIVAQEFYAATSMDHTTQLLRIRDSKADYVWLSSGGSAQPLITVRDAAKLGIKDIKFVVGPANDPPWMVANDPVNTEGAYFAKAEPYPDEALPGMEDIKKAHLKYKGKPLDTTVYITGWVEAMIAVEALRLAVNDVGVKGLNGPAVRKGYESMKNFDTGGLTRPVSYGPDERRGNKYIRIHQAKGGKLVGLTDWIFCPLVTE